MSQESNVQLVREAFNSGSRDLLANEVVWHFLSPVPELVARFEGRDAVAIEWPEMLDEMTAGTFRKHLADVWPVGDDLVVAHVEVEMTIGDEHHAGASVVVYRIADGTVVEGFDIPSASI